MGAHALECFSKSEQDRAMVAGQSNGHETDLRAQGSLHSPPPSPPEEPLVSVLLRATCPVASPSCIIALCPVASPSCVWLPCHSILLIPPPVPLRSAVLEFLCAACPCCPIAPASSCAISCCSSLPPIYPCKAADPSICHVACPCKCGPEKPHSPPTANARLEHSLRIRCRHPPCKHRAPSSCCRC